MNNWGAVLALALCACAIDSIDTVDSEPEIDNVARPCGVFGCLQNTATGPDGEVFDELDWTGAYANAHGVRILSFTLPGGVSATLQAEGDALVAYDSTGRKYKRTQLNDGVLQLSKDGLPAFEAVFKVDPAGVAFWGGDTTDTVYVYDITVRRLGELYGKSACRNNPPAVNEWFGSPYVAIAFEGDRYKHETHTVRDSVGSTWFNLACAGGYPSKLHLLRHTWAGSFGSDGVRRWPTTLDARLNYLRAIVADYHGDGTSWTRTGVRLEYGDTAGIRPIAPYGTLEAIWKNGRAVCLNEPRVASRSEVMLRGAINRCVGGENGYVFTKIP